MTDIFPVEMWERMSDGSMRHTKVEPPANLALGRKPKDALHDLQQAMAQRMCSFRYLAADARHGAADAIDHQKGEGR